MSNKSRRNSGGKAAQNSRARSNRPQPKVGKASRPAPTGEATGWRRTMEIKTGPLLVMMHSMPRWLLPVGLAAALFFGLILAGSWAWLGAILLGLIGVFLAWLLALSWPMLAPASRVMRSAVVICLLGVAVLKALGRF